MDMTEETTTSWRAGAPPTAPEARMLAQLIVLLRESMANPPDDLGWGGLSRTADGILTMARTIIPDDGDREAAMRYAVTAWDPRTGVNGLESILRSFGPAVPRGWEHV